MRARLDKEVKVMEPNEPAASPQVIPQPWYGVWAAALTKPTVSNYEQLASQPHVSTTRASVWVFLSGTLGSLMGLAISVAFPMLNPFATEATAELPGLSGLGLMILCLAPLAGVLSVFGLYISAGISHVIARALGGTGEFRQLAFAIAAYTSPISLVSPIIGVIPVVNCLAIPISLFALYLNILSIKAVHRFSWGRALLSSVLLISGILFTVACLLIGILALLGPAIGNVFSNIITELGTPTP
jgi:hypothetical protein